MDVWANVWRKFIAYTRAVIVNVSYHTQALCNIGGYEKEKQLTISLFKKRRKGTTVSTILSLSDTKCSEVFNMCTSR